MYLKMQAGSEKPNEETAKKTAESVKNVKMSDEEKQRRYEKG